MLIVITPGGSETKHLVDAKVLRALGPEGILINVARGSVVDEQALVEALRDNASRAPASTSSPRSRGCRRRFWRWSTSS